jgi:hypothetical protein
MEPKRAQRIVHGLRDAGIRFIFRIYPRPD